jgi:hypothetical protein
MSETHETVHYCLSPLGEEAFPVGPTLIYRLAAYLTESLALHVSKLWPHWYDINRSFLGVAVNCVAGNDDLVLVDTLEEHLTAESVQG